MTARFAPTVAFLAAAAALAVGSTVLQAQRPALTGEKGRVAESVRRDLTRLSQLQRTHHDRTNLYAADLRDLSFSATSGASINIAFASANAWAANASHATLSPVKCFVIVSAADAVDAPTAQPFCTDAEPGTAAARVAAANPPPAVPATTPTKGTTTPTKSAPAPTKATRTPTKRVPVSTPVRRTPVSADPRPAPTEVAPARSADLPSGVRMITRDAGEGVALADRVESMTSAQFTDVLLGLARDAVRVMDSPPPEVVRDPYESSQEFEARRAQAFAAYQRREQEYFRSTKRSFVVQLPVRAVRYDADAEILQFSVDAIRLPTAREGRSQLTVACFTRPVFWCMPDAGMTYDASDLWKIPRATARRFDLIRSPLTLTVRFTVGGRPDGERSLAVSLVDMDLQARGESVQRWPAAR